MSFRDTQNPGIGGLDELTLNEEVAIQTIAALGTPGYFLRTNLTGTGIEWALVSGGGFSDPLTTNGDIIARIGGTTTRLAQGGNGTFLGVSAGLLGYYTPAGTGDMSLGTIQTVTALKTFNNGTFGLRNVADSFTALFTNTNTAARTYTLKDADGTIAFVSDITGTNSGVNTGDQTTLTGFSFTKAQLNTAINDGDAAYLNSSNAFTFGNQSISTAVSTPLTLNQNDSVTPRYALRTVNAGPGAYGASFESTSPSTVGSALEMFHNSASPANGDFVSVITFAGNNSAAAYKQYGTLYISADDVASTSEDSSLQFDLLDGGAVRTVLGISSTGTMSIGKATNTAVLSSIGNQNLQLRTGNATTGLVTIAHGANGNITIAPNGTGNVVIGGADIQPDANDGGALGKPTIAWSDVYFADGGVINFNNGNSTITHSAGLLTMSTPFAVVSADGTTTVRNTVSGNYAGMNMFDDTGTLTGSFQIGGTTSGAPFQGNMFLGSRRATGELIFVRGAGGTESGRIDSAGKMTMRIKPRVETTTSSATPTINTDNVDFYSLTAQAVNITSFTTNLSGTPDSGQKLWISITGTAARTIAWGASFEASTVALPTTTVTTDRLDVGFIWNAVTSKWRCVATA